MRYISTRGSAPVLDFRGATLAGLASDGGLYVPEAWPSLTPEEPRPRAMRFNDLRRSEALEHVAERQWRFSVPVATILLALLAVPLSRSRPREGRYGRITIGLLVFIIYFNLLSAAKAWTEEGTVDPRLGLWWVHGGILLLTIVMIGLQNGWHRRILR